MPVKVSDSIFLNRIEVEVIKFIASRPEMLSKMGYRVEYISEHIKHKTDRVRTALNGLIITGLAKRTLVPTNRPGRKPYLYTFPHSLLITLSDLYKRVKNFTTYLSDHPVAMVLTQLAGPNPAQAVASSMTEVQAIALTRTTNINDLVKQRPELVSLVRRTSGYTYSLTGQGYVYGLDLKEIQNIITHSTHSTHQR